MNSKQIFSSYITYKELFATENYKNQYEILAEFIKYIIVKENLKCFSIIEIKNKLKEIFEFNLPKVVIKTSLKNIEGLKKEVETYNRLDSFSNKNDTFINMAENSDKDSEYVESKLISYIESNRNRKNETMGFADFEKQEILNELLSYLTDEINGEKYSEEISRFIVENETDAKVSNYLKSIKEGSILYCGLSNNISEIGGLNSEITLYLDMEILFNLYGYNGEIYRELTEELILLVNNANRRKKCIKLRYFEETKKKIESYFQAAEMVIENRGIAEGLAMKEIIKGCQNKADIVDKKSDFFHKLGKQFNILQDSKSGYYNQEDYDSNLEDSLEHMDNDEKTIEAIKMISHINKLRKNQIALDYLKAGFYFITESRKTLEQSKEILRSKMKNMNDENPIEYALSTNSITNILWFKLSTGFSKNPFPKNANIALKAKMILAQKISNDFKGSYEKLLEQYKRGEILEDQVAARLKSLTEKLVFPENISETNLNELLDFSNDKILEYETKVQNIKNENEVYKKENEMFKKENDFIRGKNEEYKKENEAQKKEIESKDEKIMILEEKIMQHEEEKKMQERENNRKKEKKEKWIKFIKAIFKELMLLIFIFIVIYLIYKSFSKKLIEILQKTLEITAIVGFILTFLRKIYKKWKSIFDTDDEE